MRTPTASAALPLTAPAARAPSLALSLLELTKPRLAVMSVLTTAVTFYAGASHPAPLAAACVLGATLLSAGGALSLNHWRERDTDPLMRRTQGRPLPRGAVTPTLALAWSVALSIIGVAGLAWAANLLAAGLSALTIVLYAFVYTPLKRRTRWATEIGAIPGALPPLIGAAAATGHVTALGMLLTAVIFCWQMPHFFAIGWLCREDYRAAGFPLLPAIDLDGVSTASACCGYSVLLLLISGAGVLVGVAGPAFGVASLAGGAWLVRTSIQFLHSAQPREVAARKLFGASLAYLPLVLLAVLLEP